MAISIEGASLLDILSGAIGMIYQDAPYDKRRRI